MGTSFLCGKYLISLFKLFYNIKQTLFSKNNRRYRRFIQILSETFRREKSA